MKKLLRKPRPNNLWRIGEMESWFSDMSAQGWHVQKIGALFVTFVQGEPVRHEYRLEFAMKRRLSDEQRLLYEDCGWDYVDTAFDLHLFVADATQPFQEIHTDPTEQSYTLDYLQKKMRFQLIYISVLVPIIAIMQYFTLFADGIPIYHIVQGYSNSTFLTMFVMIVLVVMNIQSYLSVRKLRQQLEDGIPIDHHAPWQSYVRRHSTFAMAYLLVTCLFVFIPLTQLLRMDDGPMPEDETALPFIRLAEIEQDETLERDVFIFDDEDLGNYYYTNWSFFAPVQYDTSESGKYLESDKTPSVHTDYYELRFRLLVQPFVEQLMERKIYDPSMQVEQLDHPLLDQLYKLEDDGEIVLFAVVGNKVTHVRYYGDKPAVQLIEAVAAKLTLQN